jgi:superfamily II DNA or RNA helicase
MKTLRHYQEAAIASAFAALEKKQRTVIVNPTGSGKTVLISHISKLLKDKKVLVLTTRTHIFNQFKEELTENMIDYVEEKASSKPCSESRFVLASAMSMKGERLKRWNQNHFDYILADECHHASSNVYKNILWYFNAKAIGFTATPNDPKLCPAFDNIAYDYTIRQAIKDKWLASPVFHTANMIFPLKEVRITAGEFNEKDLDIAIKERITPFAKAISEKIIGQTLVFVPTIATAELLKLALQTLGFKAEAVHSALSKSTQDKVLNDMKDKSIQVVINPASLTEGWNLPSLDTVIIGRPTTKLRFLIQMVGRALRPKSDTNPGIANIVEFDTDRKAKDAMKGKTILFNPTELPTAEEALARFYRSIYGHVNMFKLINAHKDIIEAGLKEYLTLTEPKKPLFNSERTYTIIENEYVGQLSGCTDPGGWPTFAKLIGLGNRKNLPSNWTETSYNSPATEKQIALLYKLGFTGNYNQKDNLRGLACELISYITDKNKTKEEIEKKIQSLRTNRYREIEEKYTVSLRAAELRKYRKELKLFTKAKALATNASESPM